MKCYNKCDATGHAIGARSTIHKSCCWHGRSLPPARRHGARYARAAKLCTHAGMAWQAVCATRHRRQVRLEKSYAYSLYMHEKKMASTGAGALGRRKAPTSTRKASLRRREGPGPAPRRQAKHRAPAPSLKVLSNGKGPRQAVLQKSSHTANQSRPTGPAGPCSGAGPIARARTQAGTHPAPTKPIPYKAWPAPGRPLLAHPCSHAPILRRCGIAARQPPPPRHQLPSQGVGQLPGLQLAGRRGQHHGGLCLLLRRVRWHGRL